MASPSATFNNGAVMPLFGYGTWLSKKDEVGQGVQTALDAGYKHIDCAACYGNENEVGQAFEKFFANHKREEVFITSKLWVKDFSNVRKGCEKTLNDLKLKYLDLYLIHLPFELQADLATVIPTKKGEGVIGYAKERIQEVWKEMEKLVDDGLVKSIGVSNFTIKKLKDLLSSSPRIIPACNQIELHPYLPQDRLIEYSNEQKIISVAFSPLGTPGFKVGDETPPLLLEDPVVLSIAKKHDSTAAQILIAWGLAREHGVIAKSVKESRIKENLKSLDIKLNTDDMNALNGIEKRYRFVTQHWGRKIDQEIEDLWDGEYL